MAFCNQIKPGSFSTIKNDHARIVIPLYSPSKELIGLQGRSLDSWIQPKYLTLMFTDKYSKIYGLDTINKKLPVYVVEGPFDSTFIDNCVACVVVMVTLVILRGAISFLYMITGPRNKEIVSRIGNTIKRGYKVVIWPNGIRDKDLNDMHLSGHNVKNLVESNIYSGLEATLQFNKWKKV